MKMLLSLRKLSSTAKTLLVNDTINPKSSIVTNLRNLHITSINTKEIRSSTDKVRVGTQKYSLVEGEIKGSVHHLEQ